MNIIVVGNGENTIVEDQGFDLAIASNSSFCRLSKLKCSISLLLSESLLWEKEKLIKLEPVIAEDSLSNEKSYEIRREKQKALEGAKVKDLVIFSIEDEVDIPKRLDDLSISYENLLIFSHKDRLLLMIKVLGFFNLVLFFLKKDLKKGFRYCITIFKVFLGGRIPFEFRPSIGVMAILFALSTKNVEKLKISGIGTNSGNGGFYNFIFVKNISLHTVDQVLLNLIKSKYSSLLHI